MSIKNAVLENWPPNRDNFLKSFNDREKESEKEVDWERERDRERERERENRESKWATNNK